MTNQDDTEKRKKSDVSDSIFDSHQETKMAERIKSIIGDESVKAFSRRCGIPDSSLRDYLSGKKKPGIDAAMAIASSGGVTVDWLATGKGIKWIRDLKEAQERLNGASLRATGELPDALEPYRRRLDALNGYLAQIDDERARDRIISDFLLRAEELKEIGELKHAVRELRAAYNKKSS